MWLGVTQAGWLGLSVVVMLALLAVLFAPRDMEGFGTGSPVARLVVSGTITDDRDVVRAVDRAAERAGTRALLLSTASALLASAATRRTGGNPAKRTFQALRVAAAIEEQQ